MKNRICAVFLLAAIVLTSCGRCSGTSDATESPNSSASGLGESSPLGFAREDNGGKTFNILTTEHADCEYIAEEETDEVVSDAVYERNLAVEDYLGIKFDFTVEKGHWADRDSFNSIISTSVMAGDGAYDLVNGVTVCVLPTASTGLFMNALDMKYLDLSHAWWVDGLEENLSVSGKLFGVIGDASLSLYKSVASIFSIRICSIPTSSKIRMISFARVNGR